MYVVLILVIIVCVLLTFIVLIQNPKGGGIAANFSAGNQIMGVKRTNDFIEKTTWTLAGALVVLVLASNIFSGGTAEGPKSVIQDEINEGTLQENYIQPKDLPTTGPIEQAPAEGVPAEQAPQ